LLDYLNFCRLFPQIVPGRSSVAGILLPQRNSFVSLECCDINEGASCMVVGFFSNAVWRTIIANILTALRRKRYLIWLAQRLFGLRIY